MSENPEHHDCDCLQCTLSRAVTGYLEKQSETGEKLDPIHVIHEIMMGAAFVVRDVDQHDREMADICIAFVQGMAGVFERITRDRETIAIGLQDGKFVVFDEPEARH